jgi:hypothetical protein
MYNFMGGLGISTRGNQMVLPRRNRSAPIGGPVTHSPTVRLKQTDLSAAIDPSTKLRQPLHLRGERARHPVFSRMTATQ